MLKQSGNLNKKTDESDNYVPGVYVFCPESTKKTFRTDSDGFSIGRDPSCELRVENKAVSRVHAILRFRDGAWFITDNSSKNGTSVNGVPLSAGIYSVLHTGDVIELAHGMEKITVSDSTTQSEGQKIELNEHDKSLLTDVINKMYPGIQIFVRDVNLPELFAEKYQSGQIIREKAFTDASCRVMGMVTSHRYMILSNHMANLSQFEHGTNWGLCVAKTNSHFKVLGTHSYHGKTAIILLHLPYEDTWKLFVDMNTSIDQQLLEMAIQRFEAKCEVPPIPELTTQQWLDRCSFPLGMSDRGDFWPLTDEVTAEQNAQNQTMFYTDRIRGCIFGGAVGDALGYPIEFASNTVIRDVYGEKGLQSYKLNRISHNAQISDDTQMSLFTAVGVLRAKTAGEKSNVGKTKCLYEAYLDWLDTQSEQPQESYPNRVSWLMDVSELHERRAPGNTCLSALRSGEYGSPANPINHSKGCGGIMRVAPIALYEGKDANPRFLESEAADAAAITHGHPLGYLPAAMLVFILNRIVYGEKADLLSIVHQSMTELTRWQHTDEHVAALNTIINKAVEFASNNRTDYENIAELGGGWVAEETLAIAVYCSLRHEHDFSAGIIAAVNHDGDSDSTGAVTGNILGALVGYEAIEDKWKQALELKDTILEVADDVAKAAYTGKELLSIDTIWKKKYMDFRKPIVE